MNEEGSSSELTPEEWRRAEWIRRGLVLLLLGLGVAAGLWVDLPWNREDEGATAGRPLEAVTKENFSRLISRDEVLTVMNLHVDGNPQSEKLRAILSKIEEEKPYGDRVACAEWDVVGNQPEGSKAPDQQAFLGQLDFYAKGQKLGSLKGETDPKVVDETIKRYLAGLVKRYGPGWLPDVEGLQKGAKEEDILKVEEADAPVRTGGGGASPPAGTQP